MWVVVGAAMIAETFRLRRPCQYVSIYIRCQYHLCPETVLRWLMFQVDDLVQYYKGEVGSLPCKLLLAAARQANTEKDCSTSESKLSKYSAKRRKRNIDMEEILIVNREL